MMKGILSVVMACCALVASAGVETALKQARSVHLFYSPLADKAMEARGTVTVTETQDQSYFAILCFDRGYCGIQDLGHGQHIFIFSVWEPGDSHDFSARQEAVAPDRRVRVLSVGPTTKASRFGGEGTGGKTMTPFDWKVGEPVSAEIKAESDDEEGWTKYTCRARLGDGPWQDIAVLSTLGECKGLGSIYSFVEDFRRNYKSATVSRRAEFKDFATKGLGPSRWIPATSAVFSADSTQTMSIDAGATSAGAFFLQTGGDTKNEHVPLWGQVTLPSVSRD